MAQIDDTSQKTQPEGENQEWNYHPQLPIALAPFFDLPLSPKASFTWLTNTWFKITPPINHLLFAIVVYVFLWPPMPEMQALSAEWVMQIFTINFGSVLVLAGSLHAYLYVYSQQKSNLKFDRRLMEKGGRFTFGSQVWDNMFCTLAVSVPIWTAWTTLYFYCAANGWIPVVESIADSPVWFVLFFIVIRFWQSFHFYWIHRLIHMPWLFKKVHYLHHRNVNVGPWSGLAMHPVEGFFYFSGLLIHFLLPSHPIHVLFHMFALSLGAVYSHAGFNKIIVKDKEVIKAGSFHHQLHHRYFECNYGSEEMPLDRWFNSFHDGTTDATKRIRARKKLIFSR